jgi:hypothetical protein
MRLFALSIWHHLSVGLSFSERGLNGPLQANYIKPTTPLFASEFLIRSDHHFDIMGKGVFVCIRPAQKIVPGGNVINILSRTQVNELC